MLALPRVSLVMCGVAVTDLSSRSRSRSGYINIGAALRLGHNGRGRMAHGEERAPQASWPNCPQARARGATMPFLPDRSVHRRSEL